MANGGGYGKLVARSVTVEARKSLTSTVEAWKWGRG
jgi:hypothetical protein